MMVQLSIRICLFTSICLLYKFTEANEQDISLDDEFSSMQRVKDNQLDLTSTIDCGFEIGFCNWKHENLTELKWTRGSYSSGNGYYIDIEASSVNKGKLSRLISPKQSPGQFCLTFLYSIFGSDTGHLNVYLAMKGSETKLFTKHKGFWTLDWWTSTLNIKANESYQIVFEGVIRNSNGDIAIDDFFLKSGPCSIDCDFDRNFCNWMQYDGDDFNWRRQWKTPTSNTGPSADHTSGRGYYIYIESSKKYRNDTAILLSPSLDAGKYCISYWYHMYGSGVDRLRLQLWHTNSSIVTMSTISSAQGQQWLQDFIYVSSQDQFKIAFEGRVKDEWNYIRAEGDIAIDDVQLFPCHDCIDPTPIHGKTNSTNYEYGTVVAIQCERGYILKGDSIIMCETLGQWNGDVACIPYECGNFTIQNGTFITPNGTTFGQVGKQECDIGFILLGDPYKTCTVNGWSNTFAYCGLTIDTDNVNSNSIPDVAVYVLPLVTVVVLIGIVLITVVYLRRRHPNCIKMFKTANQSKNAPTENSRNDMAHSNQMYNNEAVQLDDEYATIEQDQNKDDGQDTVYYAHVKKRTKKEPDKTSAKCVNKAIEEIDRNMFNSYDVLDTGDLSSRKENDTTQDPDYDNACTGKMSGISFNHDDYSHLGDLDTEYQHPLQYGKQTNIQEDTNYSHIDRVNTNSRYAKHSE